MKFDFKKDILPHLLIYIGFILIIALYFQAFIFDGKVLTPNDILSSQGSVHEVQEFKKANPNEEIFWTNTSFGGMPSYMVSMDFRDGNYAYYFL